MSQEKPSRDAAQWTRRDFLKTSMGAATAALTAKMMSPSPVHAAGNDLIKVGLIGCGGRGTGAAGQIVRAAPNVQLWALGDLFQDRLDGALKNLESAGEMNKITRERCFVGFDAYKKVLDSGVDLVILATPPAFRPQHFRAAIEAGKHAFIEKPVAVCPAGVRSVIETARMAAQKGLGVVAGTCYRHHAGYLDTIKRIHDGAIGKLLAMQAYYNTGSLWNRPRLAEWSDVEWQVRNWLYFTWLSGDFIVEQHVHSLDIVNWVMKGHPEKALSMGGRQVRVQPEYGNVFDHFTTEYEYADGVKVLSMCRQIAGCANRVSENVIGSNGTADPRSIIRPNGKEAWRTEAKNDMYVQELTDLVESIRAGKPLNEGQQVAESSLTAIMARMSAYTGQEVTWDQAMNSKLDLMPPADMKLGPHIIEPIAVPGQVQLI